MFIGLLRADTLFWCALALLCLIGAFHQTVQSDVAARQLIILSRV